MVACAAVVGCSEPARGLLRQVAAGAAGGQSWHDKHGWKAADFFADPQVIALCEAIQANDLERMRQLMASGADVNARGKGNMTPLLWGFFDDKPERFRLLLEAGADPNVYTESDFGLRQAMVAGDSVTHMACRSRFGHFWPVFEHGGDPNLPSKAAAEGHFGRYDLCLLLLDLGADPSAYEGNELTKITHLLCGTLEDQKRGTGQLRDATPEQMATFNRLVERLEAMGESMAAAQADRERWGKARDLIELGEMRRKEIAERKRREQAAAADKPADDQPAAVGDPDARP